MSVCLECGGPVDERGVAAPRFALTLDQVEALVECVAVAAEDGVVELEALAAVPELVAVSGMDRAYALRRIGNELAADAREALRAALGLDGGLDE